MEQLKIATAQEIIDEATKVVTISTGKNLRIGYIDPLALATVVDNSKLIGMELSDIVQNPDSAAKFTTLIDTTVIAGVVEPKITQQSVPGMLTLQSLKFFDKILLFAQILKHNGYTAENLQKIQSFQKDEAGKGSTESGEEKPDTPQ